MDMTERAQRFASVYDAHLTEIYRFIFLRTGCEPETAQDITQNVFLDVYKGFERFRADSSLRTWIFQIARNKVQDHYRRQHRKGMPLLPLDDERVQMHPEAGSDLTALLEAAFDAEQVMDCLRGLPMHYRTALILKYVEHCKVRDIAGLMDRTPKSVDSLLQRAKALFIARWLSRDSGSGEDSRSDEDSRSYEDSRIGDINRSGEGSGEYSERAKER